MTLEEALNTRIKKLQETQDSLKNNLAECRGMLAEAKHWLQIIVDSNKPSQG